MPNVLRFLLAIALLVASGLVRAEPEQSLFVTAVHAKLSRLATLSTSSDRTTDEAAPEQAVLVDVTADGQVVRVQDQLPVADRNSAAKIQRLILMASPFPKLPAVLSNDYSTVRLAIVYLAAPGSSPSVKRVEVKGGFRYVEFKGAL